MTMEISLRSISVVPRLLRWRKDMKDAREDRQDKPRDAHCHEHFHERESRIRWV